MVVNSLGPLTSKANFKNILSNLYLFISTGQGGSLTKKVQFYFVKDLEQIHNLKFKSNPLYSVAMLTLLDFYKEWIEDIQNNNEIEELDKKQREEYEKCIKYSERPYYFKRLTPKKGKQEKEIYNFYQFDNLDTYNFYDYKNIEKDFLPNRKEIEFTIKEVLTFCKTNTDIQYLDYILDELNDTVYFFYRDRKNHTKIITYEIEDSVWKMWNYKLEKNSNAQSDIIVIPDDSLPNQL